VDRWQWNGEHYSRTLLAWLDKHDANRDQVLALFSAVYGEDASLWFQRWRMFYLACAELFAYNGGTEWFVGHYLFQREPVSNG
jgi:Cyclopropane fatty acid synthase and related methyltransferases